MTRVRLPLLTALAAAVLLLALAPAPAAAQGPGGLYGDTLVVATTSVLDPNPLNRSPANAVLHSLVYDSLAVPSAATLVPGPWLASSWDVNLTAGSVTFHIQSNARFADGSALTADAVVASYQRYVIAGVVTGFSVSAPDATTAVFSFTRGGGDFLGKWVTLPIAYTGPTGPAKASGLFTLGAAVPGASLTITANANHWRGRPYLDAIRYEFHPGPTGLDDAACDLIEKRVDFLGVPLVFDDLTAQRPCGVLQGLGNETLPHIFTAIDPGFRSYHLGMNTQRPPLNDAAFRVAVTSALDREGIRTVEGLRATEVADSVVLPENSFWFNASVPKYRVVKEGPTTTNLDNVNEMLDGAGYFDRNGDGWREMPNGSSFALKFFHLSPTADPRFSKIDGISTNLRAVGVDLVELERSDADILANVTADNFDLFLGTTEAGPDPGFLFDMFHSSRLSARNYNNLVNSTLDAALERVRDDLDRTARQQAAWDVQGWLGSYAAAAPLVHYRTVYVYNRERFQGWVREPGGIDNFWTFAGLHVIQKGPLSVSIGFTNAVASGGTTQVIVTVLDRDSLPVQDADVVLTGGSFSPSVGLTDATGRLLSTLTAPVVPQTVDITVRADVSKPGYDAGSGASPITVRVIPQRLTVFVERSRAVLEAGGISGVTVTVIDANAQPVAGATVTLRLDPAAAGGTLSETTGTTPLNGTFFATLTATVGVDTTFRVTAIASASGFVSSSASTSVLAKMRGGAPPPVGAVPGLDTVLMVLVVAAAAVAFSRWQTRRRKQP
jgi:peptide/nickel transport system substrate-binding protein